MTKTVKTEFICACEDWHRLACQNQPFFKNHKGKDYCVLHYPDTDKLEEFRTVLSTKLVEQDYDFRGTWFPELTDFRTVSFSAAANFSGANFSAEANFNRASFSAEANFNGASFCAEASFNRTTFSAAANFNGANFCAKTNFFRTNFSATANFIEATFCVEANFYVANFCAEANFIDASFGATANFKHATFKHLVRFAGSKEKKALGERPCLDFQFTHFEKPDRVSFHTLILRPHWFINVDSRKFEFTDVDWGYQLKEELKSADENKVSVPHRLLAIAFRQLADNAEANHRYYEASRLRYNAFEARRIEKYHGFVPWRLDWWYWLASGYGESVGRAFLVFVALLALFTLGYKYSDFLPIAPIAAPPATVVTNTAPPTAPDLPPKRLGWREAALYSFNVSILQKPEPKPKGLWASFLVSLETVLGPAQAALLALAVRRRFMR